MSGPRVGDVYGALLDDVLDGKIAAEVVERDDGFVMAFDARYLVAPFTKWDDANEQRAMRLVRGRVLDAGCGGGRVCLHLQDRGFTVVGIDSSPGAIAVCRRRGVHDARVLPLNAMDDSLGLFHSIVMLGQNFGMLGSRARGRRLLGQLSRATAPGGRILAETFDPHSLNDRVHQAYRERNRRISRMPGQLRVRIRYRDLTTQWFDWLQVSRSELSELLRGTPWTLARTLGDGPSYVAVIEKLAH